MKRAIRTTSTAVLLSVLLGACANSSAVKDSSTDGQSSTAASSFEKIEEAQVARDQGVYRETQARIANLNSKQGIRLDNYALAKAQCWLDVSFHEYSRNDRGGFPKAALHQAQDILTQLERGVMPDVSETPLVNKARRLRDDLWSRHVQIRNSEGLSCAAARLACAEVELVHAGNEIRQGGWRHASPYIQIAEDLTAEAEQAAKQCQTGGASVAEIATSVANLEVRFLFDQYGVNDILPSDLAQLRSFAEELKAQYVRIDSLNLIGYADRMGNANYNTRLSMQRAMTVRDELQRLGVTHPMAMVPMGAVPVEPSACQELNPRDRDDVLQCLQPDRRVSIEVVGVRKP